MDLYSYCVSVAPQDPARIEAFNYIVQKCVPVGAAKKCEALVDTHLTKAVYRLRPEDDAVAMAAKRKKRLQLLKKKEKQKKKQAPKRRKRYGFATGNTDDDDDDDDEDEGGLSDGDELQCDTEDVPLICPLSKLPMKVPARFKSCEHLSCCDLESWIAATCACRSARLSTLRFQCPNCSADDCRVDDIEIDLWLMKEILMFVATSSSSQQQQQRSCSSTNNSGKIVLPTMLRFHARERRVEPIFPHNRRDDVEVISVDCSQLTQMTQSGESLKQLQQNSLSAMFSAGANNNPSSFSSAAAAVGIGVGVGHHNKWAGNPNHVFGSTTPKQLPVVKLEKMSDDWKGRRFQKEDGDEAEEDENRNRVDAPVPASAAVSVPVAARLAQTTVQQQQQAHNNQLSSIALVPIVPGNSNDNNNNATVVGTLRDLGKSSCAGSTGVGSSVVIICESRSENHPIKNNIISVAAGTVQQQQQQQQQQEHGGGDQEEPPLFQDEDEGAETSVEQQKQQQQSSSSLLNNDSNALNNDNGTFATNFVGAAASAMKKPVCPFFSQESDELASRKGSSSLESSFQSLGYLQQPQHHVAVSVPSTSHTAGQQQQQLPALSHQQVQHDHHQQQQQLQLFPYQQQQQQSVSAPSSSSSRPSAALLKGRTLFSVKLEQDRMRAALQSEENNHQQQQHLSLSSSSHNNSQSCNSSGNQPQSTATDVAHSPATSAAAQHHQLPPVRGMPLCTLCNHQQHQQLHSRNNGHRPPALSTTSRSATQNITCERCGITQPAMQWAFRWQDEEPAMTMMKQEPGYYQNNSNNNNSNISSCYWVEHWPSLHGGMTFVHLTPNKSVPDAVSELALCLTVLGFTTSDGHLWVLNRNFASQQELDYLADVLKEVCGTPIANLSRVASQQQQQQQQQPNNNNNNRQMSMPSMTSLQGYSGSFQQQQHQHDRNNNSTSFNGVNGRWARVQPRPPQFWALPLQAFPPSANKRRTATSNVLDGQLQQTQTQTYQTQHFAGTVKVALY